MTYFGSETPTYSTAGPQYVTHSEALGKPVDQIAGAALGFAIAGFIVPLLPAIVALFLSSAASRSIAASEGSRRGTGMVLAARICASVAILLAVLAVALILLISA